MGSVNAINTDVDLTVRVFDEFYNFGLEVDSNDYNAVNSFFESIFTDQEAAQNLTVTFFRITWTTCCYTVVPDTFTAKTNWMHMI